MAVNFAIGWAFFGVRMSLVPLFVTEEMDCGRSGSGSASLCSSVAQAGFLLSRGEVRRPAGRRPRWSSGSLLAAAAFAAIALVESLPVFLVAMTAIGVGGAFVGTAPGAVVGDIMHGRGGRVVAVFQMASDAGAIIGPLVAGCWPTRCRSVRPSRVLAVVLLAATVLSLRMPETLPGAVRGEQLRARRRLLSRRRTGGE